MANLSPKAGPNKSPGARLSHYGSTIMEEMTDMVMHEGLNGFYHRQAGRTIIEEAE